MTLRGVSITGGTAALQSGNIEVSGTSNVTIANATVANSTGACISADNSTNVTISGGLFMNCVQEGFHASAVTGLTITGARFTGNNAAGLVNAAWEAGGGKIAQSTNVTFTNCEVDHNGGPGIWFNVYDSGAVISNNRVHDNTDAGILYEISYNAHVFDNVVWNNGWANTTWAWGAGIISSTSQAVEIDHNTVAWNADGIAAIWQNRGGPAASGLSIHDNVIVQQRVPSDTSDIVPVGFMQDSGGTMYTAGTNTGARNQFWLSYPEASWYRFQSWNGTQLQTLAQLNASPAGGDSSYLTVAQVENLLTAASVPIAQP